MTDSYTSRRSTTFDRPEGELWVSGNHSDKSCKHDVIKTNTKYDFHGQSAWNTCEACANIVSRYNFKEPGNIEFRYDIMMLKAEVQLLRDQIRPKSSGL